MGFSIYYIFINENNNNNNNNNFKNNYINNYNFINNNLINNKIYLKNNKINLEFIQKDSIFYLNKLINNKNEEFKLELKIMQYESVGSGAYIFFPKSEAKEYNFENKNEYQINLINDEKNNNIQSLKQVFNKNLTQSITLYKNKEQEDIIEIETTVLLDYDKEMILRFNTDIKSNNLFYTDPNGLQTIKRVRQIRFNDTIISSKISGNF
jgi:hypothetical protein